MSATQPVTRIGGPLLSVGGAIVMAFLPNLVPSLSGVLFVAGAILILVGLLIVVSSAAVRGALVISILLGSAVVAGWAAKSYWLDLKAPRAPADFRDELLQFIDLTAAPMTRAAEAVLYEILDMKEDEAANEAFRYIANQGGRALHDLSEDVKANRLSQDQTNEKFCDFFGLYFSDVLWQVRLGKRVDYNFATTRYAEWRSFHMRFLDELRIVMRDSRFGRIRQTCANDTDMHRMAIGQ